MAHSLARLKIGFTCLMAFRFARCAKCFFASKSLSIDAHRPFVVSIAAVRHHGYNSAMTSTNAWKYLVPKPKSNYRQLFVKDRWIAARTLYGQTVGQDARTATEVAADFQLPLDVVVEAIAYCESRPTEISEDWRREEALIEPTVLDVATTLQTAGPPISSGSSAHEALP